MHMIDQSTGRAAIAYRNEKPWHGLGQQLPDGKDIDAWRIAAGLNYDVKRAPVQFTNGELRCYPDRHVLYRSDTNAPLSVVGKDYRIVQPEAVLEFFRDIVEVGNFELETAGALSDGKRVWALAKVSEGIALLGKDHIRPYLLMATSYDATMSTIAKFVCERVVCHNTITIALNEGNAGGTIRVHHGKDFDAEDVKKQLGVGISAWDRFVVDMKYLANRQIDTEQAEAMTLSLLPAASEKYEPRETKGFKRIMDLFSNQIIGNELVEGPSAWRWLNAVTQFVDWERGISPSSRVNSAWFGEGDAMKSKARAVALESA